MKILLDARMYGLEHSGIGRYVINLIDNLQETDHKNSYIILGRKIIKLHAVNFMLQEVNINHYSLREQVSLSKIISKTKSDVVHFPHFNVPLFFNKPYVVTIHDLIKHESRGMRTTTRGPLLYWVKYLGYKKVFNHAVQFSKKIIVPSNAVKDDLLKNYYIPESKVVVIYEGVDQSFKSQIISTKSQTILKKYKIIKPYLIYTGSVYPHKNVEKLIQAVKILKINLIIVSSRNVFLERIVEYTRRNDAEEFVNFLGFIEDSELAQLYKNAKAFVFPSLSEGFGLPGLEAMAASCPVICSDIPVFREIYSDSAAYFNPHDIENMVRAIRGIWEMGESEKKKVIAKGEGQAKKFSWKRMAEETLKVYVEAV